MTWANIPLGDAGDLSAGSRGRNCLPPPGAGWRDRCPRPGGEPVAAGQGGGRESKATSSGLLGFCPVTPKRHPAPCRACTPQITLGEEESQALEPEGQDLNPRHSLTSCVILGSLRHVSGAWFLMDPGVSRRINESAHGKCLPAELAHGRG